MKNQNFSNFYFKVPPFHGFPAFRKKLIPEESINKLLFFFPPAGRHLLESAAAGKSIKSIISDSLDELLTKLPPDLNHIIAKIRNGIGPDAISAKNQVDTDPTTTTTSEARSSVSSTKKHIVKFVKPLPKTKNI